LPYDPKTKAAVIPPDWIAGWKWFYDGVWNKHFMPTQDYFNSDQFNKGNVFPSGNLAMAWVHTWYFNSFDHAKMSWDIAVMPTINGKTTAKLHGDTFAIMKDCKAQDAAFKALTAMIQDKDLQVLYGGMPAKPEDQAAFFATLDQQFAPNKINWSVAQEMLKYPDVPNHEAWTPNPAVAKNLFDQFRVTMETTPLLDLNAAIAKLKTDLDAAYKAAPAQ
jgi:multiple sugar transport system substrate-binding protein